jgi:hypothetical protein
MKWQDVKNTTDEQQLLLLSYALKQADDKT